MYYIVIYLRNKLFQTLICVLIYASKETPFQQYFALKVYTFSYSSYPFISLLKQPYSFQNLHVMKQFYSFFYPYVLVLTNQKTFSVRSHVRSNVRFFNVRSNVSSMYSQSRTGSDVTNYLITGSDVITLTSCRFTAYLSTGSDVTNRK